jgi:archaellum component FlaF (FlaF/FlaG flagellin family)
MPGKFKGDHSFQGDYNVSSGNEVGSGNRFFFSFDGTASLIAVLFIAGLVIAVIVYMAVDHGGLLAFLTAASFILIIVVATVGVVTFIVCKTWLVVSHTRSQHVINQNNQQWSRHVYQLPGGQVASLNPATRELTVHSVRDVQEVHHHNQQIGALPSPVDSNALMPSLYDTLKDGNS